MVDLIPVVDGDVKFRDGKKWKMRYAVVTRLSPVADSLTFQIWKNRKDKEQHAACPSKGSLVLEDYIGIETGFTLDKESLTLAILLKDMVISLAFNSREVLMRWQIRISSQFESGRSFGGTVLQSSSKVHLNSGPGPVKIYVHNDRFYLGSGLPPFSILHSWKISHLRRYGPLEDNRFVFEGGSLCGKGEGIHIVRLAGGNASDLKNAFDLAANRKLPCGSIASLNTDSPGNSFSSSSSNSNGGCSKLSRHHFSTSCDTMSEVLSSEFNPSIEGVSCGGPQPEEGSHHHLVNRRNLLEKIYSLCEKSSDKIKSSVYFDPSWSMKEDRGGRAHPGSFDSLISFNETESKYDNPRSTTLNHEYPKKLVRGVPPRNANNNVSNGSFIFENYDIPKAIPPSSLYDVPRSLHALQDAPKAAAVGAIMDPGSCSKVRVNGQGKMPLADLRNGLICLNGEPSVPDCGRPSSGVQQMPNYINLLPQGDGESGGPLYENMVPAQRGDTGDGTSCYTPQYDTINIKLRKFADLLNNPSPAPLPPTNAPPDALDHASKRKSTSLGSLLEQHQLLSDEAPPAAVDSNPLAYYSLPMDGGLSKSHSLTLFVSEVKTALSS